jgi:S1-C subfamily serine protease
MTDSFTSLSNQIADAAARAAASVVQVHGHRRPSAGVLFAEDVVLAPAETLDDDSPTIRRPDGSTVGGTVLGRSLSMGLAVVRVPEAKMPPIAVGPEPKVGHLAIAVGRTSSGALMTNLTSIAVVGGPLQTSRTTSIDRVIRVTQAPHGAFTGGALVDGNGQALGVITSAAIRRTTVVLPAAIAWSIGQQLLKLGGAQQGFLGVGSSAVSLPERQRAGRDQEFGLLITAIVPDSPAESAGLLVGDVIVSFDGVVVQDPEALVTLLRGDRVGKPMSVTVLRGGEARDIAVTIRERPRRRADGGWR